MEKIKVAPDCDSVLATRPILYIDTVGGRQALRDDLWAVTTEELNKVHRRDIAFEAMVDLIQRIGLSRAVNFLPEELKGEMIDVLTLAQESR